MPADERAAIDVITSKASGIGGASGARKDAASDGSIVISC